MSVPKDRKLQCYPSPKYSVLIKAYAKVNEISESEAGSIAVKTFIDNLPADQKTRVLNASKEIKGSKNSY